MNYIKEINSFYQRQETNPLSSHAANLWHTLMHINNRAGWQPTFTVSVSVICSKSGLSNSTFKRARTELRDKGYIHYESRSGNQAAIYEILSLQRTNENDDIHKIPNETVILQSKQSSTLDHTHQVQSKQKNHLSHNDQEQSNLSPHPINKLDHNVGPLLKQKETKQEPSTAAAEVVNFFDENFSEAKPYIITEMLTCVHQLGQPLVLAAMKRALDRGKGTWGYVRAILQDWKSKGFKTIGEAEAEVTMLSKQPKQTRINMADEVIPDWFHERDSKKDKPKKETAEEAKERREVDRLLASFA